MELVTVTRSFPVFCPISSWLSDSSAAIRSKATASSIGFEIFPLDVLNYG